MSKVKSISPLFLALLPLAVASAFAEQTAGEKVSESARDAKVATKKTARKVKKKVRDATGNGSAMKDMKDSAKNAGDSIDNAAKTAKDKVD
jgi:hypothetical protein